MGYHDAEVSIQDVNAENAAIHEKGWIYVTSLKDKKAPLYFAPYFSGRGDDSGITKISRVKDVREVVLAEADMVEDLTSPPSEEHAMRWSKGLSMLRDRALAEGFAESPTRLFFLDSPIDLWEKPLSKKAFRDSGISKQIPNQIPKGFHLGFDDLLSFLPEMKST